MKHEIKSPETSVEYMVDISRIKYERNDIETAVDNAVIL